MKTNSDKIVTQSDLARALGVSRQLVAFHKKTGKSPASFSDTEAWRTYLAAVGRQGSAPRELQKQIAQARLAILRETKHSKSRENRIEDGAIMDSVNVKRFITSLVSLFFQHVDTLVQELPTALKGKTELDISEVLEKRKLDIVESLKSKMTEGVK